MSPKPNPKRQAILKSRAEFDAEVEAINERLNYIAAHNYIDSNVTDEFDSLPLLDDTKKALAKAKFTKMSPIQRQSLLFSLAGRDLLGAAETGTGKTLSFLIPVIELLKKQKFGAHSGIGAIIISPTRDLASQTYNVLKDLIKDTSLSAGLVTGGLDFVVEQTNLPKLNICIATIGRLKEHAESSPTFNVDNLKILVLDEADRLLGTEFIKDLKHIIEYLPQQRQTLMFTATAGKAIKSLTKITLQNPARVILTDIRDQATPDTLNEFYTIVPLPEKLNTLYSFIKSHKTSKIVVFMETVKMVRYVYEAFRHLRIGMPISHLTGKQSSDLRFSVCRTFATQQRGVIFTTDVAARGLDFPNINWVVQMDCPVNTDTYIHRVGRTARFYKGGNSLLFLIPSEIKMVEKLEKAKTNLKKIQISEKELVDIKPLLVDILAKFSEVKHLAKKAFINYIRCVKRREDEVFNTQAILAEAAPFAASFGLLAIPEISTKKKGTETTDNLRKEEESESSNLDDLFEIVEDESQADIQLRTREDVKPKTMEFVSSDMPISEIEWKAWRNQIKEMLVDTAKKTKVTSRKQKAEETEPNADTEAEADSGDEPETVEDAAAKLLFADFE